MHPLLNPRIVSPSHCTCVCVSPTTWSNFRKYILHRQQLKFRHLCYHFKNYIFGGGFVFQMSQSILSFQRNICPYTYYSYNIGLTDGYFMVTASKPTGWFHLVFNLIGLQDGDGITIYHNGADVGDGKDKLGGGDPFLPVGSGMVVVGRSLTSKNELYASVMVDELLFFNRYLSIEEIQMLYNMYK